MPGSLSSSDSLYFKGTRMDLPGLSSWLMVSAVVFGEGGWEKLYDKTDF